MFCRRPNPRGSLCKSRSELPILGLRPPFSQGQEIPAPFAIHDFSGRIAFRIPRSIHKQAAKFAEMDGTSLNQFFLAAVAARVGAEELYERLSNKLEAQCMRVATAMPYYTVYLHGALKLTGPVNTVATQIFSSASPEQTFFPLTTGGIKLTTLGSQIIEEEA